MAGEDSSVPQHRGILPKIGLHAQVQELETLIAETLRTSRKEAETLRTARSHRQQSGSLRTAKIGEAVENMKKGIARHIVERKSTLVRFIDQQKDVNEKIRKHIDILRDDNASLQQTVIKLQRRLREVDLALGD
ncbi:hypothetical protein FOL47_001004 [Perkinsus chesapeaki]|uniref:Uncharacterized protein n=1 Tax=Perkinsus chesapeaki TaxID=330153 RepID=A0A7J6KUG8_PERCH|nr:hypothetical protein FOL47_001004 [Perkinsus chesapeaki]